MNVGVNTQKLIESLCSKTINEGNIIIINNDAKGADDLAKVVSTANTGEASEQQSLGGKRWNFKVKRNDQDQIVSIDATEIA